MPTLNRFAGLIAVAILLFTQAGCECNSSKTAPTTNQVKSPSIVKSTPRAATGRAAVGEPTDIGEP